MVKPAVGSLRFLAWICWATAAPSCRLLTGIGGRGNVVDGQAGQIDLEVLEAGHMHVAEADDELRAVEVLRAAVVDDFAGQLDVQMPVEGHGVGQGDHEVAQKCAVASSVQLEISHHQLTDLDRPDPAPGPTQLMVLTLRIAGCQLLGWSFA